MNPQTPSEQRLSARIAVEMPVEERIGTARYFQRATNLSLGGIWLEGTFPHPKGTEIELSFTLPGDAEAIRVRGEIVGDLDPERLGMHIRFTDLGQQPEVAARIAAFIHAGAAGARP